ncbi:hypothetical protein ABZ401_30335 [Streptomyces sp. NPDC005892]|uniref:hypothetical protein n=1 Tax=Streptomyces sp. NPDC005892 TaxID=3155593 RepID=UPI0033D92746
MSDDQAAADKWEATNSERGCVRFSQAARTYGRTSAESSPASAYRWRPLSASESWLTLGA